MLKVQKIIDKFKLEVANEKIADLKREVNSPSIHRMGLELSGFAKVSKTHHNVIT